MQMSRRDACLGLLGGLAAGLMPTAGWAISLPRVRRLSLHHVHTNERLSVVYFERGRYVRPALAEINHLLRDWRADAVMPIDPRLLDLLVALRGRLRSDRPLEIICGYRCPATNRMLQRRGGGGVATNSLHLRGRAIDLRVPGRPLDDVRDAAKDLRAGGVGYYPDLDFVHVDTGRVRYW
jgi:uncharacterized protein YcbK (DUF882 family)